MNLNTQTKQRIMNYRRGVSDFSDEMRDFKVKSYDRRLGGIDAIP